MSSSAAITRQESEEHDPNYLFQIHRQTMQLCDHFDAFSYRVEGQFDAVFTEFRKVNERFEDMEPRVLSLERNTELIKGEQLRLSNDVHEMGRKMERFEADNAEIKSTLQQILEKLS